MTDEDTKAVATVLKVVVFPVIGFIAGFFMKWFLQSRKSRDELLRALASDRANAFEALWQRVTLPDEIRRLLRDHEVVPGKVLQERDDDLLTWYVDHANALFLSWRSTDRLFRTWDVLRSENPTKETVDKAFSRLRTSLKRDCGVYTGWNAWRRLRRPSPRQSAG